MHKYLFIIICLISACTRPSTSYYTIQMPEGWQEVEDQKIVEKHVFWAFSNNNYTKHTEEPIFRAWDAPDEENAFVTIMELKRHRNLGMGKFYNEVIRVLQNAGWVMQERGTCELGGERCKWWNQAYGDGIVQQRCYMVANGPYYYVIAFTTSYLGEDKQKHFDKIAETLTFYEGA